MYPVMQTTSSGDLKTNPNAIFDMTRNGPVVILSKATPKAVLVSPEEWNRIAHRLSELEFNEKASRATQEWRESDEPDLSFEEFMAGLRAHHG